jgi:hypothetical protein
MVDAPTAIMKRNAMPRSADDFETIRRRMAELREPAKHVCEFHPNMVLPGTSICECGAVGVDEPIDFDAACGGTETAVAWWLEEAPIEIEISIGFLDPPEPESDDAFRQRILEAINAEKVVILGKARLVGTDRAYAEFALTTTGAVLDGIGKRYGLVRG